MKSDKHSYFKEDIRRILFLYAIVPVVLLTVLCLIVFWGSWRFSLEKTNKKDNKQITADLERTITSYIEVTEKLVEQKDILTGEVDVSTRVEIFENIYEVSNKLDRKANLYIFDHQSKPVISSKKTIPDFLDSNYYGNWGILRMMNQHPDDVALKLVKDENSDTMQLVIGKAMVIEGKIEGYIVFILDSKQFQISIADLESQTIITDEYGWVYASNNYSFLDNMDRYVLKSETKGNVTYKLDKYYITSNAILNNRIHIYSISPLSNQISMFLFVLVILIFVFAMMIFAVFLSSKKVAVKKTMDLYTIIRAFEKVKEGDLNTYLDISSNDEFTVIGESYNLMLDSLKEQINTNKEMGRLVITSQAKQLESQFNPHFLYNTLENIRFMCKLDAISASNMIYNLSSLLRYSINNSQEEVTVKEDVFYTENYMSILKYRFNQRFHYVIDLPDIVERCIIPKLIIQPMIENAIKYGFEGKDKLSVKISGSIEKDKLVLMCYDNGAGMSADTLKEIKEIMLQNTNRSHHSGLFNIHRRVQLKYGQEYGVQIESELGIGTYSSVVLPVKYEEDTGGQKC